MLTDAIVGATGFVGGTIARHCAGARLFNSKNIADIRGCAFDVVYAAGAPAVKWLANKDPAADAQVLEVLRGHLATITCNWFVLISTIDTETETSGAYGAHRKQLESWAQQQFPGRCTVFRLPALFGMGLKKNALYDLLNNNQVEAIKVNHIFQWYDMRDLWTDLKAALASRAPFLQAYSEPILFADIVQHVFPERWDSLRSQTTETPVVYDFKGSEELRTSSSRIIARMVEFRRVYELCASGHDVIISNLAWQPEHESLVCSMLRTYGFRAFEVAPTRYGPWEELFTESGAEAAIAKIAANGLRVHSVQAVFYTTTFNVFTEPDLFIEHFRKVLTLSQRMGAKAIVFGSPANRLRPDGMSHEDAVELFVPAMKKVADFAAACGVVVCVEPNATAYKCNFMTTLQAVHDVVERISHPNIRINYDTGNAAMENDALTAKQAPLVYHVQVSEPFLAPVRSWPWSSQVALTSTAFKSVEMKPVSYEDLAELLFSVLASYADVPRR